MPIETACLKQDALLWVAGGGGYGNNGNAKVGEACAIKLRLEDKKGELQNGQGDVVAYDAIAYVDRAIAFESWIYLGTATARAADTNTQYYRVVGTESIPDIKGRYSERSVFLARGGGTLPTSI